MGQLLAQIEETEKRLKELRKRYYISEIPQPLENPDMDRVVEFAKKLINEMAADDYNDDNDNEHWAYETVMEAVYGKSVWDWINKNIG